MQTSNYKKEQGMSSTTKWIIGVVVGIVLIILLFASIKGSQYQLRQKDKYQARLPPVCPKVRMDTSNARDLFNCPNDNNVFCTQTNQKDFDLAADAFDERVSRIQCRRKFQYPATSGEMGTDQLGMN